MKCPYCKTEATFGGNEGFYGRRFVSGAGSYMAYYCKPCNAYVGTHHNDPKRPLGTMANGDLRKLRMAVHAAIDPLWKSGEYERKEIYHRLSDAFGEEIHVGESDEKRCQEILESVPLLFESRPTRRKGEKIN